MKETLQTQTTVTQTPIQNSVATNNDEKNIFIIYRLGIAVIVLSAICFFAGIANALVWISIWQGVWCSVLPFVAGLLGVLLKSNSIFGNAVS